MKAPTDTSGMGTLRTCRSRETRRLTLGVLRQLPTALTPVLGIAAILAAPRIARAFDRRGLPGNVIALGLVVGTAIFVGFVVWTSFPKGRRAREMATSARALGLRYRSGFRLPTSLRAMPSLSAPGWDRAFVNLVAGRWNDREVLVFDVGVASASGYSTTEWITCSATELELDAARVAVEPIGRPVIPEGGGLSRVRSESAEFDARYRVLSDDPSFASAIIDARMMQWLLGLPGQNAFGFAGRWALCSSPQARPTEIEDLLGTLDGLVTHVPRVATSLSPSKDPGLPPPGKLHRSM
jgi:hypothetical protein